MATDVVDFLGFGSKPHPSSSRPYTNDTIGQGQSTSHASQSQASNDSTQHPGVSRGLSNGVSHQRKSVDYELPEVSLFRQEKLVQLFQHCGMARSHPQSDPLGAVSENLVKTVVYRWIVRAAHDTAPYLDPMIPSWTDSDRLTTFLQRQFISESRKGVGSNHASGLVSMEALKEAGVAFSRICQNLAKDLVSFRYQREEQLPQDWSDTTLGLSGSEVMRNGMGSMVCVDWANRAQIYMPTLLFAKITERHTGSSTRFLTALFSAKKRYEIKGMLASGTTMDYRLSPTTKEYLARDAAVSVELWSDPFSVHSGCSFFGQFRDVDASFGGHSAFGRDEIGAELAALKRGASVMAFPPLDSMVAASYIRRIVDLLEAADKDRIPLSFVVVLHAECFLDINRTPTVKDVVVLDSRLGERQGNYVRCAEVLPPGQHSFFCGEGEGSAEISRTGSLFLLLQNEAGKLRYSIGEASLVNIIRSMSVNVMSEPQLINEPQLIAEPQFGSAVGYTDSYVEPAVMASVPFQPDPIGSKSPRHQDQPVSQSDYGTIGGQPIANAFNDPRRPARRGRLFDLIEDGDDGDTTDVDVVSGMLTNLDANLFKSTTSQDVDIEAISLMGIGGAPLGDSGLNVGRTSGRFG